RGAERDVSRELSMLALQRSAGNRAVAGLVEPTALPAPRAPVAGVVQRFHQPSATRPDWRRSTNGRIVIYGKKLLFADDAAIGESNDALARVAGRAGAYLRLTAGSPLRQTRGSSACRRAGTAGKGRSPN